MKHPIQQYHHYLHHRGFGEDCTACPHNHPEIDQRMYAGFGIVGLILVIHMINSKKHQYRL